METVFSKIIRREIPATIVYEDDFFLAFLDINPVTKGHTLLVPKTPYVWMQDVPDELLAESFILAKKIMKAMVVQIPCDYVQVGVVGEEVPHFHIHLIPQMLDPEKDHTKRQSAPYQNTNEMNVYATKISQNL